MYKWVKINKKEQTVSLILFSNFSNLRIVPIDNSEMFFFMAKFWSQVHKLS